MKPLNIRLVPGEVAPSYNRHSELECEEAVVTEQATEKGLPIVDFVLKDSSGKQYVLTLSGRIVGGLASVIRGVNERNHGVSEP